MIKLFYYLFKKGNDSFMTPAEFTEIWKKRKNPTIMKFTLRSPLAEGLSPSTAEALKEYGLPNVAGSWLEFGETDYIASITTPLTERNLYPIGQVGIHGYICINMTDDTVVIFYEDDPDEFWLMNTSLNTLYESLMIYDDFIIEVKKHNPNYDKDYKIPEGMLGNLQEKLTACDPEAMKSKSYWYCQVGALDNSTAMYLTSLL